MLTLRRGAGVGLATSANGMYSSIAHSPREGTTEMIFTDRLTLRGWREDDRVALAAMHADPEVMQHLGGVKSREQSDEIFERLTNLFERGEPGFWAAELSGTGKFVGWVGLRWVEPELPFAPALEIGWRLARGYWGSGLAAEGASASLKYAFESLKASEVYAFTRPDNVRSEAVMKRIGLRKVEGGDFHSPHEPEGYPKNILYVADAG